MFRISIFRERKYIDFEQETIYLDHAAVFMGDLGGEDPVLCRIHSECLTGDVLGSLRCDCGFQLDAAMEKIAARGRGVLLYMRQEGRGIGLFNKIRAYRLQDEGQDTYDANVSLGFPPDLRDYARCAEILRALGVSRIVLMTNNPDKMGSLERNGIEIAAREPMEYGRNAYNEGYLRTKGARMGHLIHHQD